jgi:hypothetical protein
VIVWLKAKHRTLKTKGRYKSSSNDQGTKHSKKTKATDAQRRDMKATQPRRVMVLDARTGRTRMTTVTTNKENAA